MADQEFLASFGVDIDEGGVSRLQQILTENRTLAESLSKSFEAASESVKAFKAQVTTDLPSLFSGNGYGNVTENLFGSLGGLKIGLNMTEPKKEIASFTADAKKPIDLTANANAIVSAARTALEEVRSLFSQTFILNVRAETSTNTPTTDNPTRGTEGQTPTAPQQMSAGGRFSRPTSVEVAEDGDAEYIIPVKKENRALPLLRQLLAELSPEARARLTGGLGGAEEKTGSEAGGFSVSDLKRSLGETETNPTRPAAAAGTQSRTAHAQWTAPSGPLLRNLSDLVSGLSAATPSATITRNNQNVSAPVTINVNASGSDPEAVGRTIYNTAERYLLRTLRR